MATLNEKLDEYYVWLEEETQRQAATKYPEPKTEDQLLDEQMEQWKELARQVNGWKK